MKKILSLFAVMAMTSQLAFAHGGGLHVMNMTKSRMR